MNHTATIEKMVSMRLRGMASAFQAILESGTRKSSMTPDEMAGTLVDAEWEERQTRKLERLIQVAKFRHQTGIEDIDFTIKRNLDKDMIMRLTDCVWIEKAKNVIITGPTGVGKSHLASAFGHEACRKNYRVLYFNCLKLFTFLKQSQADHSYSREIRKMQKADLIILDDFGLQVLDVKDRTSLLEILEDRQGDLSTLVVSQLPVSKWHETIGESTVADAICDRLVHSSYRVEMNGQSVRKHKKLD
jgi:DNA replication protein DnaC